MEYVKRAYFVVKDPSMRLLFIFLLAFTFQPGFAQQSNYTIKDSALYATILHQDSLLYDAYNRQDFDGYIKFFSKDLEWYKDTDGKMNYDTISRNFRQVFSNANRSHRKLLKNTLEIYPIKNYGAISTGMHEVNYTLHGKVMRGQFKFFMVWEKQGEEWKITRVFSYGH